MSTTGSSAWRRWPKRPASENRCCTPRFRPRASGVALWRREHQRGFAQVLAVCPTKTVRGTPTQLRTPRRFGVLGVVMDNNARWEVIRNEGEPSAHRESATPAEWARSLNLAQAEQFAKAGIAIGQRLEGLDPGPLLGHTSHCRSPRYARTDGRSRPRCARETPRGVTQTGQRGCGPKLTAGGQVQLAARLEAVGMAIG